MKIAILTLQLDTNYGQILQCYAMQTYLQRNGHEAVVLDDARYTLEYYVKIPFIYIKRAFQKIVLGKNLDIFTLPYQKIRRNTIKFIDEKICRNVVRDWDSSSLHVFDVYIVGSDQVWRPKYFISDKRPLLELAFLSFVPLNSKIKLSYAASFGTHLNEYSEKERVSCLEYIKDFSAVSVREDSGIQLCRNLFGIEATQVLDPTMLLQVDDYIRLFQERNVKKSNGDLFVYLLDRNDAVQSFINDMAKTTAMTPNYLKVYELFENPENPDSLPSIEQWIRNFYDASFVVTDSFHGCVFSILFNKPFVVFANENRGLTRINSLLKVFDLTDHLIIGDSSCDYSKMSVVNWPKVNRKLDRERMKSIDFLKSIEKKVNNVKYAD